MLKCPHCGARVKGPDLLTGVCSSCQQRLTSSIDSAQAEFADGAKTFLSDEAGSAEPGSSLDKPADSDADPPPGAAPGVLSESFGGGFDLVRPMPAPAAGGPRDHDTGDSISEGGSAEESAQTFISDELSDPGTADSAVSAEDDDGGAERTFVSDVVGGDDSADDAGKTFVSDEVSPGTMAEDAGKTFVSDEFGGVSAGGDADQTFVSDSFGSGEGDADETLVSDDVPESLVRTVQSHWDDAAGAERAQATLKGKDTTKHKGPKSTLVIKTKTFRDVKVVPASSTEQDPDYEIVKVLGEGGMGVVYRAKQMSIDREVALKMIKGPAAVNEKQKDKFLAEAVVTGDLDHPNIVPIYDVGQNGEGSLFYSMKMVSGTPWDKAIEHKSLAENLEILMKVADAIAFAGADGVVHRDLKPENTMIGEFGEVLVMDWGLAQPSKKFRRSASITETSSMGGTPAYMAPEMATGPLEKITHLADVYLLGAILYEIVTGRPPHTGKNAMKCLMAAARNEITPTEKTGELVDIALHAMATSPADRYQDVKALQTAIRDYESHTESISQSTRAEERLVEAKKADDYQQFAAAVFGFQDAYKVWDGNKRAETGVGQAKVAYAESALHKGDFDLGLSLLDEQNPEHQPLRQRLLTDKQEREARVARLARQKRMLTGLAALIFVVVCGASLWINHEKAIAVQARDDAVVAQKKEEVARKDADVAKDQAIAAKDKETLAKEQEALAKADAVKKRDEAVTAQAAEKVARLAAEEARQQEEIAKRKEEYEAYIAQIGLAAAKINENAFDTAEELLKRCKPELRNWEWGRLMHLCSQSDRVIPGGAPLDSIAVSADGAWFATGGWDGTARVWNRETGKVQHVFKHGGQYVHSVAFSPDGRWLATGGDDPQGFAQIWDIESGQRVKTFSGHEDGVLSVSFSRDGQKLLTSSYDKTARLWDVETSRELKSFKGHTWWVWQAAFSPTEDRVVTVGQDGTALVWEVAGDRRSPPFTGHQGPVYCAAFSPDGKSIVTGGYDHRLLVWQPEELQPFNYRNLEKGGAIIPPTKFRELDGHATSVRSVSFSADGRLLLSSSQDNTVRLWEFATGAIMKTFRGHSSFVKQAVFVPDGRRLLSASHDNNIREWSISGYEELRSLQGRRLEGHADAVLAAAFSPDQKSVVTASRDRTARVWDARTGAERVVLEEGHSFLASTAKFFDGGKKLMTAAVDNTARVWDVATGTQLQRFDKVGRSAAAAVSPDQRWLLTGGAEKQAQLWDLSTGQRVQSYPGHLGEVTAVAFSLDAQQIVTADAKGHAYLWNRETAERLREFKGHSRKISAITFSSRGDRVITASIDKTVAQWNIATGKEIADGVLKHPDSVLSLAVSADGRRGVSSSADRKVRVWNLETLQVEQTFGPFPSLVYSLALSDDGGRLLTAHAEERIVRLWDLSTGKELQSPRPDGALGPVVDLQRAGGLLWAVAFAPGDDVLTVGGSDARLWDLKTGKERISFSPHGAVASARFSPDGLWVVTGSWDNSAKIWDAKTGHALFKLEGGHEGFVNSAVFSPDGRYVLTAADDGLAVLWDVRPPGPMKAGQNPPIVKSIRAHEDRVRFATFSHDGKWIVTASGDKTAKLWNAATGEPVRTFAGHDWSVLSADFSEDGTRLITGSEDNSAKVWDVATGDCLRTLLGHTAPVNSVAFAPDGNRLLTGSQDQAAKLWDASSGREILTLNRHTEDVTSVCFSPDGKQVLTGSRDGTAVIWLAAEWRVPVVTLKPNDDRSR